MQGSDIVSLYLGSILIIFFVITVVVILILMYQRKVYSQQQKLNTIELEYEKELNQSMIKSQERERKRIAEDLHDDLGSSLSAIRLNMLMLARKDSTIQEEINESAELIGESIEGVRRISRDLLPVTLTSLGIVPAVEELSERINSTNAIAITFQHDFTSQLPTDLSLAIYRVIQELINNTIRHAQAEKVHISMELNKENLRLFYADNGIGLPNKEQKPGLGMKNIQSRMQFFDATVTYNTGNSKGFEVNISIPSTSFSNTIE